MIGGVDGAGAGRPQKEEPERESPHRALSRRSVTFEVGEGEVGGGGEYCTLHWTLDSPKSNYSIYRYKRGVVEGRLFRESYSAGISGERAWGRVRRSEEERSVRRTSGACVDRSVSHKNIGLDKKYRLINGPSIKVCWIRTVRVRRSMFPY